MTDEFDDLFRESTEEEKKKLVKKKKQKVFNQPGFHTQYDGNFMMDGELEEPDYLVDDFLARQNLTNLSGHPGGGKTIIAISLIVQNKSGFFLDKKCKPICTLFIDEENGIKQTRYVFRKALSGIKESLSSDEYKKTKDDMICYSMEGFMFNPVWETRLKDKLRKLTKEGKKPDLIVFDNISRTFEGDANKIEDARRIHKILKPIAIENNLAVLLISHTRKGNPKGLSDISGSGDFGAQVSIAYITKMVRQDKDEGTVDFWLRKVKNNLGFPQGKTESLRIKNEDGAFTLKCQGLVSEVKARKRLITEKIRSKVIELLVKKPMPWRELSGRLVACNFKEGTVKGVLANMKKSNEIVKDGDVWKVA